MGISRRKEVKTLESISIMGYDASEMLFIHDDSGSGRIHFWILVGILIFSYVLYNFAILIWTQYKIRNFTQYQAEMAHINKVICADNADSMTARKPYPASTPNLTWKGFGMPGRRDIRTDPAIRDAMEGLAAFGH